MTDTNPNERQIPFARIVHQPSPVYRMRYKAEKRNTFLFSENNNNLNSSLENLPTTSSAASASTSNKKATYRKKNGALNETPDGTFPKIEVSLSKLAFELALKSSALLIILRLLTAKDQLL